MNHPMAPRRLLVLTLVAASAVTPRIHAAPAVTPPVAEVRNVPTTLHGTVVNDPYRWMEDLKSPQTLTWLKAQGEVTRSVLDRIDGRDAIAARLAELAKAQGDTVRGILQMPGERYYYLKRAVGERQLKLVMRLGLTGAERTLVDPEVAAKQTGVPHAINYFKPSWDGKTLAYGLSAGGSEDASLYLMDIASGEAIAQPVSRVQEGDVHWLPDSRSLTYNRFQTMKPGAPETDAYKDSVVLLQRVVGKGKDSGKAVPVFGPTVNKALKLDRLDVGELLTVPGSRWAVVRTTDTTVPEGKLFVAPVADLGRPALKWRRIGSESDKVVDAKLQGDSLVVLTQAGAPRRKIVKVDLKAGTLANATLLAAEPADGVLQGFELTPTALLATQQMGTQIRLRRYAAGDTAGKVVPAPAAGAAWLVSQPAHHSEDLLYSFTGWTEPARLLRLQGDASTDIAFGLRSVPPGLPALTVTEVLVPSHDGVKVPMTILHRQGLKLDGSNPVLLYGYASYGLTISARFSTDDMAWIERGGVMAYTNPRGSGVYGDDWHRAGFKATKPNTWKDGIACAKYLIANGYGSAKTMGIMGTSAGGIFVGRAVTEAPELFAAAIFDVGSLDTLRAEESANGATNISEFGTVKDPDEFRALLAMSTYQNIRDGTAYPGVLLVHGMNDPRVEVWNSGKVTARLQAAQAGLANAGTTLLRLDLQAGHGVGSTLTQRQAQAADIQSFLLWQMGKAGLKD
jgi:prolyl oligopeptidase